MNSEYQAIMPTKVGSFCSKFRWHIFAVLVVVVATAVIVPVVTLTSEEPAACSKGEHSKCHVEADLIYFFTTTRKGNTFETNIEYPPNSNFLDSGVFTCKADGLHLFTVTLSSGGVEPIQLKRNAEIISVIPVDDTKTNSLTVAINLKAADKVKIEGAGDLMFTGVTLYSFSQRNTSKTFWGSRIKKINVQNIDQPIILQDVDGSGLIYNNKDGSVKIQTPGVYMITLNLGSDDSSYASLDINNVKILGLGEDRDGRKIMSNFLLKEFNAGDTIKPTLQALGNIYDDNKQTQFAVTSLIDKIKDCSFCAFSSHYVEFQTLDTVKFDQTFLSNGNFDKKSGIYSHAYEKSNPKRYYLLSATAFMGKLNDYDSAELRIQQWQEDEWISLAVATTTSTMRSMLQVSVIAQMDQDNDKIRVRARGFKDEGPDVNFATFCGFRLGIVCGGQFIWRANISIILISIILTYIFQNPL